MWPFSVPEAHLPVILERMRQGKVSIELHPRAEQWKAAC